MLGAFLCAYYKNSNAQSINIQEIIKKPEKYFKIQKNKPEEKIYFSNYTITIDDFEPNHSDAKSPTISQGYLTDKNVTSQIIIEKSDEGIAIMNNSTDTLSLVVMSTQGEKDTDVILEFGDFYSIHYEKLEYGNYTVFISGKYGEVVKMFKISKVKT